MKNFLIYTMTLIFLVGCATPPQKRYTADTIDPPWTQLLDPTPKIQLSSEFKEKTVMIEVNSIIQRLDRAIINIDPLIDFWDKIILIPIESGLTYDSNWTSFIDQKEIEYKNDLIPACKKELLNGFRQIGVTPKEDDYNLLKAEFIIACMENPKRAKIRVIVFKNLTTNIDNFFMPIFKKVNTEVQKYYESINKAFISNVEESHKLNLNQVMNYLIDEKAKLSIRAALDKKYTHIFGK